MSGPVYPYRDRRSDGYEVLATHPSMWPDMVWAEVRTPTGQETMRYLSAKPYTADPFADLYKRVGAKS